MTRHLIELAANSKCRACGRPATFVRHDTPGVYRPETDAHFCEQHIDGMTEDEVRAWTQGWELGRAAGLRTNAAPTCGKPLNYSVGSREPADHCQRRVRNRGDRCWQHADS